MMICKICRKEKPLLEFNYGVTLDVKPTCIGCAHGQVGRDGTRRSEEREQGTEEGHSGSRVQSEKTEETTS